MEQGPLPADVVNAIWKSVTICGGEWGFVQKGTIGHVVFSTLHICNLRASRHNFLSHPQNGDNRVQEGARFRVRDEGSRSDALLLGIGSVAKIR